MPTGTARTAPASRTHHRLTGVTARLPNSAPTEPTSLRAGARTQRHEEFGQANLRQPADSHTPGAFDAVRRPPTPVDPRRPPSTPFRVPPCPSATAGLTRAPGPQAAGPPGPVTVPRVIASWSKCASTSRDRVRGAPAATRRPSVRARTGRRSWRPGA
ncbi:hypothetical protein GCM10011578_075430 [Streptomyces fuscichromogenes]|uniref:Uncharacterized protein n=1 Tax=Streptomyces fuscichromogenes TaxID=1324013 RepID=A0A918CVS0_9ACTN|nr:hypothetical protein GCM10011578_075430 [Streptomyces fuscichromogenes]